ncbi:MAG: enolase C-terminal domain-like protein [Zavarzinella sp.]
MKNTDVRIVDVHYSFATYLYRTPIKFGGVASDRVTILDVECTTENRSGVRSKGFGSMPLGNIWSFPSKVLSAEQTLQAMQGLVEKLATIYAQHSEYGHPVEITMALEHQFFEVALAYSVTHQLAEPIPRLCTLVCASPFDAALHDAYGKCYQKNCFSTYSSNWMTADLGQYLGEDFQGEYIEQYVTTKAKPQMPLYHLVGALDPLEQGDVVAPVGDGLPETLAEWIPRDGLAHLKIKLNGDDLNWDLQRIVAIDRVATIAQSARGISSWFYSLDFNERCENVEYLISLMDQLVQVAPLAYDRVQYVEQPTRRDLHNDRGNTMHAAAKRKPVVIDESLLDLETLLLAREMGYTGVALKACKGQSQSLLMAAAAKKYNMFLCVQDLTCPGASLIHSASIAAHIPAVSAIEANSRQFVPAANKPWLEKFPGIFHITSGTMDTSVLDGIGLGAVPPSQVG